MAAVLPAVQSLVEDIVSEDKVILARCQLALQLAAKLDEAVEADSAASAMATPSLSKELRAAIEELSSVEGRKEAFRAALFDDD